MKRELPRRRNTRLPGWNYRLPGPYAITMCTEHRVRLFGETHDGRMVYNDAGLMVVDVWSDMVEQFPTTTLDAFVVMPNHVHAIVLLDYRDIQQNPELGTIVQRFKSISTSRYARGVKEQGWPPFDGQLWQRNYYEHIIRDERDLDRCRAYIEANPANWSTDQDNIP